MTRKFLTGLGIEAAVIEQILEASGADIEREKAIANDLKTEIETLKQTVSKTAKEFEESKSAYTTTETDLKAQLEAEKLAHGETKTKMKKDFDDYKTGVETEKTNVKVRGAVTSHLKSKGASPTALEKELFQNMLNTQIDSGKAKFKEDGTIENLEDLAAPFVTGLDFLFGTTTTTGVPLANPPPTDRSDADLFIKGFDSK